MPHNSLNSLVIDLVPLSKKRPLYAAPAIAWKLEMDFFDPVTELGVSLQLEQWISLWPVVVTAFRKAHHLTPAPDRSKLSDVIIDEASLLI